MKLYVSKPVPPPTPSDPVEAAAFRKLCRAAAAMLTAGTDLRRAQRHFTQILLAAAVLRYGTKERAAQALGVHRNTVSRLSVRGRKRAARVSR